MRELKPKDKIALVTLLLIAYLKTQGINGELDAAGALILGYYFAKRHDGRDNGI